MNPPVSPAVDRAADAARTLAGPREVTLGDWLRGLIADDEGKPAVMLQRLGVDLAALTETLTHNASPVAPAAYALYAAGREKALELTSDATLTTDTLLLAVLDADAGFHPLGVTAARVEALFGPAPEAATEADPGPTLVITEPVAVLEVARVVDANLNRAREALRVLDDYARFIREDAFLTAEVKRLRHDLADAASLLPATTLLAARDTLGDVGTTLGTAQEYQRGGGRHVAAVNLKRLQESLRCLEEYGKVLNAEFARRVEAVRYVAYTLERILAPGNNLRGRIGRTKLYALLTGSQCVAALDWTIKQLADGGVEVVQLREKSLPDKDLLVRARSVRRWTAEAGVLFIVNDRPDIARLVDADGVHLGQDDLPVAAARRIVGPESLIGVSTHDLTQLHQAVRDGADYLGVGPTFPSVTKAFTAFPGLDFVRTAFAETTLPAFALGGINITNIHQVIAAGGTRVAISSAFARADEPGAVAAQIHQVLGEVEQVR